MWRSGSSRERGGESRCRHIKPSDRNRCTHRCCSSFKSQHRVRLSLIWESLNESIFGAVGISHHALCRSLSIGSTCPLIAFRLRARALGRTSRSGPPCAHAPGALRSLFCVVDFDLGFQTFILELQACLQRRRKGPVFRVELSTDFDDIALARVSIVRNKVLHKSLIYRGEAEMPTQISYVPGIAVRLNDRVNFS